MGNRTLEKVGKPQDGWSSCWRGKGWRPGEGGNEKALGGMVHRLDMLGWSLYPLIKTENERGGGKWESGARSVEETGNTHVDEDCVMHIEGGHEI